jgi:hypothetical protein
MLMTEGGFWIGKREKGKGRREKGEGMKGRGLDWD